MKIKTRLTLYNILIIAIASFAVLFILGFIARNITTRMENVNNEITVQEMEVNRTSEHSEDDRIDFRNFLIQFILLSTGAVTIVIFFAFLFSNKLIKKVMQPVEELSKGATRVKQGNYNEDIKYNYNNEFTIVIDNFNEMQRALKEEKEKNIKYETARQNMINGINHDINTPLTAVKGYIKGIQDGVVETPEKVNQYLSIAYNRTIEIENLMKKMMETFNTENGEMQLHKTKVEIGKFIEDYINKKKDELKEKNIEMNFINSISEGYLMIDEIQFTRVFDNLLSNSIKYSGKNNLKISINAYKENGYIKIGFKDNGVGVKEENLPYIFNEFYKEDDSRTNSKETGIGLGLFIVKNIVEAHKGTIKAENSDGLYFEITMKGVSNE